MIGKCIMFASCSSTKHIKCELSLPHECNHDAFPCPLGIVFGSDSRVFCFETKEKPHGQNRGDIRND